MRGTRCASRTSRVVGALALLAGFMLLAGQAAAADASDLTCKVDPDRELFIRDTSVVNDCLRTTWGPCPTPGDINARGAWTFGRLMEGVFGTTNEAALSDNVLKWLGHWERNQVVNEDFVPARPSIRDLVTDPWLRASGGFQLDMKKAPFRLLAIVARLDQRRQPLQGNPTAGEGRFVFGVIDLENPDILPQFTVIVEYNLKARTCQEIKDWAKAWHGLGSIPFGPDYNKALQEVTDKFTRIKADPDRPNASALDQIRTNEIALAGPWELREFKLTPSDISPSRISPLIQTTVAQTPDADLNNTQLLADYINEFTPEILDATYVVPLRYQGTPFRGGASPNVITAWDGPLPPCSTIDDPEARHLFSLNTCNSCHGRETDTRFLQVEPRFPEDEARLSDFLTGGPTGSHVVVDPCGIEHSFNDIERRVKDLCKLLQQPCLELADEKPLNRVH